MTENKITAGTIARTICLALALINQLLTVFGVSPLPIGDELVTNLISTGATIAAALIAWWKNNSISNAAMEADKLLHALKQKEET